MVSVSCRPESAGGTEFSNEPHWFIASCQEVSAGDVPVRWTLLYSALEANEFWLQALALLYAKLILEKQSKYKMATASVLNSLGKIWSFNFETRLGQTVVLVSGTATQLASVRINL